VSQSIAYWYPPANPYFLNQRTPIFSTKVRLEHCECSLESPRKFLPEALKSVSSATINRYYYRCMEILNAFDSGFRYGTKIFKDHVYKGHQQVVDKIEVVDMLTFM
jgi:hypothetical protein